MASNNIEKTIRIVVTSGLVNQGRFSKGLRESLEPSIRKVGAEMGSACPQALLLSTMS